MNRRLPTFLRGLLAAGVALGATVLLVPPAQGADHLDSPAASADKTTDMTDWFAWTDAGGEKLNMILAFSPITEGDGSFSTAAQYAFHVHAHPDFLSGPAMSTLITCQFYTETNLECWAQNAADSSVIGYVEGDATAATGVADADENIRVHAGLFNDPFYFNLDGFNAVAEAVRGVVSTDPGSLGLDANGCPAGLDEGTRTALVTQLMENPEGVAPPIDDLAGTNVMALVMQVDLDLISDADNQIISTWGSTHRAE